MKVPSRVNIRQAHYLLKKMGITATPLFVAVIPELWALPVECFPNVQKMIDRFGGKMIVGWAISESSILIKANYHAIYMNPDNASIDITPKEFPADRILFVEDKGNPYTGMIRDDFRLNTTDNPLVDDLINLKKFQYKILNYKENAYKTEVKIPMIDVAIIKCIDEAKSLLESHILKGNYPNALCFCGRNKRYFECHGEDIHGWMDGWIIIIRNIQNK